MPDLYICLFKMITLATGILILEFDTKEELFWIYLTYIWANNVKIHVWYIGTPVFV